jgi:hypothetical protein
VRCGALQSSFSSRHGSSGNVSRHAHSSFNNRHFRFDAEISGKALPMPSVSLIVVLQSGPRGSRLRSYGCRIAIRAVIFVFVIEQVRIELV